MAPVNNVISLYGLYEVYYQGVYVATYSNRRSASLLLKALKDNPTKTHDQVKNMLFAQYKMAA